MLEKLEEIRESIFKFLEARIELFKLETRSQVENIALKAVHGIVLGFLATITTIFLFSLLAAYLNELLDSRYLGFLIVAGFFLLLTLIWALAKGSVENMLRKMTYNMLKNQQEKKAEERAEAIQELMNETRKSLNESTSLKE
ncbi:phage holin family protein [Larkinella sp. VNQ87]|uniref:phage holin family protein n=1 Tax=Larkinella sp. VNQ87 TaxID=3400921 RepID=UPI003BFF2CD9